MGFYGYFALVYSVVLTVLFVIMSVMYINTIRQSKKIISLDIGYSEALDILDTAIAHVISDMQLVYDIKEIKYIKNVDEDIKEATLKVMNLVSPSILQTLELYMTREYTVTYTSRNVRAFVIAYLDQKKNKV